MVENESLDLDDLGDDGFLEEATAPEPEKKAEAPKEEKKPEVKKEEVKKDAETQGQAKEEPKKEEKKEEEVKKEVAKPKEKAAPVKKEAAPVKEEKAVTAKKTAPPATIPQGSAPGTENILPEDMGRAHLKLLQNTSSEVTDGIGNAGDYFNTATNKDYSKIQIVPICMNKSRMMFDQEDRKLLLCQGGTKGIVERGGKFAEVWEGVNREGKVKECVLGCEESEFGGNCILNYNFLVIEVDDIKEGVSAFPSIFSIKNFYKAAFQAICSQKRFGPLWNSVFELSSETKKYKRGSAFIPVVRRVGPSTEDQRKTAAAIYDIYKSMTSGLGSPEQQEAEEEDIV